MGLFDMFKKKKPEASSAQPNQGNSKIPKDFKSKSAEGISPTILAMPLYKNGNTLDFSKMLNVLKTKWGLEDKESEDAENRKVFKIGENMVALMSMPAPVPWSDIEGTAKFAYNWPTAAEELKDHDSHVIVTILPSRDSQFNRFKLLTKILDSILESSDAIGIYQGGQTLLTPKAQYIDIAQALKKDMLPINLWVYIGLRPGEKGRSGYTYGLTSFGKHEMEFVNTPLEFAEINDFLLNISAYVLQSDVVFKSGETLGYTQDQKIRITKTKGEFVAGEVYKLEF